jgi:hypothetical protein
VICPRLAFVHFLSYQLFQLKNKVHGVWWHRFRPRGNLGTRSQRSNSFENVLNAVGVLLTRFFGFVRVVMQNLH